MIDLYNSERRNSAGPPPKRYLDDETAQRWRAGWGPWKHSVDPVQYEQGFGWTPRAPRATQRLDFH